MLGFPFWPVIKFPFSLKRPKFSAGNCACTIVGRRTEWASDGLITAFAADRYRHSVADDTPKRSATSETGISGLGSNVLATSRSSSLSFGGWPLVRPARFAAASLARVRSPMRARSNSASALYM